MTAAFLISAGVAIVATVFAVTRASAVRALLYLIVSLLATAVMFLTLGAPFIAALEVVIYAGAVMVLFVFAAMALNLGPTSAEQEREWLVPSAWVGPAALAAVLALELLWLSTDVGTQWVSMSAVPPERVAESLFSTYILAVELASILLMAGLIGAYHLGRSRPAEQPEEQRS